MHRLAIACAISALTFATSTPDAHAGGKCGLFGWRHSAPIACGPCSNPCQFPVQACEVCPPTPVTRSGTTTVDDILQSVTRIEGQIGQDNQTVQLKLSEIRALLAAPQSSANLRPILQRLDDIETAIKAMKPSATDRPPNR
jgi:hypothetical protein